METKPKQGRWGWKLYGLLLAGLLLVTLDSLWAEEDPLTWKKGLDVVLQVLVIMGVFGYAFFRPILTQQLWRWCFPFVVLLDSWIIQENLQKEYLRLTPENLEFIFLLFGMLILMITPGYLAIYLYAYCSPNIWQKESVG